MIKDKNGLWTTEIQYQYNYCPVCGEYLFNNEEVVDVDWDERDVTELYTQELYGDYQLCVRNEK